jgi:hypothetical protein
VRIQNGSSFNTAGFIKTYDNESPGISGFAKADADGYGGKAGTASAQTYIYNFAAIVTHGDDSPGIKADGWAYANGNALTGRRLGLWQGLYRQLRRDHDPWQRLAGHLRVLLDNRGDGRQQLRLDQNLRRRFARHLRQVDFPR